MDGVMTEGSPWPLIIQFIDSADRIFHSDPYFLASLAGVSLYYILMGGWLDLLLNACFLVFNCRLLFTTLAVRIWNEYIRPSLLPSAAAVCAATLMLLTLNRNASWWTGLGRPYLIPCKTTHTRLFPLKHSFKYSYLVVGVPIGLTGNFNGMLTVQNEQSSGFRVLLSKLFQGGWYNVDASDYLQRGSSQAGLRGKLDAFLKSQGVDPDDYPHAYLVTAARFLGYHFNPVSFWYLYTPDRILSAIVLEVNNTFDERRPYLVLRDFSCEAERLKGLAPNAAPSPPIKGSWVKDFHVSPFNSRKGTYSLLANDPLDPGMGKFRGLDITINLSSSKGHPKLVARLFSDSEAVDPDSMNGFEKIKFLCRWFWVGFATFPRIVKEAAFLFFKRKLHVWYRPEPLKESLGRHAMDTEKILEGAFRIYLRFCMERCQKPLSLRYISSGITDGVEEILSSPSYNQNGEDSQALEMKVLTPVFYSRFVHYAHDCEAIFTEMTDSGTVWTDKPQLMPEIFLKKPSPPLHAATAADYVSFKMIQKLRRRPRPIARASTSADPPVTDPTAVDIRDFRISPMDAYVLDQADSKLKAFYRSTLLQLFIADKYFMGSMEILTVGAFIFRTGFAWFSATKLSQVVDS